MIKDGISPSNQLVIKVPTEDTLLNSTLTGTELVIIDDKNGIYTVEKPGVASATVKKLIADGVLVVCDGSGDQAKTSQPTTPAADGSATKPATDGSGGTQAAGGSANDEPEQCETTEEVQVTTGTKPKRKNKKDA